MYILHFSAQETPGEKIPQICTLKKLCSSVVSGEHWLQTFIFVIVNKSRWFLREIMNFSAQEIPGEKVPTDLQLEKAELLGRFRQAKL